MSDYLERLMWWKRRKLYGYEANILAMDFLNEFKIEPHSTLNGGEMFILLRTFISRYARLEVNPPPIPTTDEVTKTATAKRIRTRDNLQELTPQCRGDRAEKPGTTHSEIRLTEDQVDDLWDRRISAEVRSLYFADLANVLSTRKQWMMGISLFVVYSGVAVILLDKQPIWSAIVLWIMVAFTWMYVYSLALYIDRNIKTFEKLHFSWNQISAEYAQLWNHTYSDTAEQEFENLIERELSLSELAVKEAPNDEARMAKWQERVFALHHLDIS